MNYAVTNDGFSENPETLIFDNTKEFFEWVLAKTDDIEEIKSFLDGGFIDSYSMTTIPL